MMRHSVQARDRLFVKGYRFLPFAKNKEKNSYKFRSNYKWEWLRNT